MAAFSYKCPVFFETAAYLIISPVRAHIFEGIFDFKIYYNFLTSESQKLKRKIEYIRKNQI